jgi:N-acetylglutamate synthase-like GNAT family acetyltransferase
VVAWAADGDFGAAALAAKDVFVADADGSPVGWAALVFDGDVAWLDDLWVDPPWMHRGVGASLFRRALAHASEAGAARLEWEAEPNAIGFYAKMGGRHVRYSRLSSWGRVLSVMAVAVAPVAARSK